MRKSLLIIVLTLFVSILIVPGSPAWGQDNLVVFAAASTTNAVTDICNLYNKKGDAQATYSFASSSTLAKQIDSGAGVDVYVSANKQWMDFLEKKDLIDKASRVDLLGNRIVLIAPKDSTLNTVDIKASFPLKNLLKDERLAMGDPDHVPAGKYGRLALESLGVWPEVESLVARTKDVRAALALVERGECPLGIVYSTDAAISDKVKVVGQFPESSHPPIVYPVAIIKGHDKPAVKSFFEFLKSDDSAKVFSKYGFSVR